jgi:hypothetical protein
MNKSHAAHRISLMCSDDVWNIEIFFMWVKHASRIETDWQFLEVIGSSIS